MNKGIKIFAGVAVFLGVLSLIFLLTAKKKTPATSTKTTTRTTSQNTNKTTTPVKKVPAQQTTQAKKELTSSQWQQCKNNTMAANTTLFWNVQISEGIPVGGTYAKGTLNNDAAFPVQITIKSGSQLTGEIKNVLVVGKSPNIRGTCKDVAADGSVVLEAF